MKRKAITEIKLIGYLIILAIVLVASFYIGAKFIGFLKSLKWIKAIK